MRSFDKNKNIAKANLLAEQRYLESKEIIKESFHEADGTPIGVDGQHRPIKKKVAENGDAEAEQSADIYNIITAGGEPDRFTSVELIMNALDLYRKGNVVPQRLAETLAYALTKVSRIN
jgi:hypothetical protein|tara:strand:- start:964 stop:1320 length:357 start_codon:yes stop_codon:yes gene_type:complete